MKLGFDNLSPKGPPPKLKELGYAPTQRGEDRGGRALDSERRDIVRVWHEPHQFLDHGILDIFAEDPFLLLKSLDFSFTDPNADYEFTEWASLVNPRLKEAGTLGADKSLERHIYVRLTEARKTIVKWRATYEFEGQTYEIADSHPFDLDNDPGILELRAWVTAEGRAFMDYVLDEDARSLVYAVSKIDFPVLLDPGDGEFDPEEPPDTGGPVVSGLNATWYVQNHHLAEPNTSEGYAEDPSGVGAISVTLLPIHLDYEVFYYAYIPANEDTPEARWELDNDFTTPATRRKIVILGNPTQEHVNTVFVGQVNALDLLSNETVYQFEIAVSPDPQDDDQGGGPHDDGIEIDDPRKMAIGSPTLEKSSSVMPAWAADTTRRAFALATENLLETEGLLLKGRVRSNVFLSEVSLSETLYLVAQAREFEDGTGRRGPLEFRILTMDNPPIVWYDVHQEEDTVGGVVKRFGVMTLHVEGDVSLVESVEARKGYGNLFDLDQLDPMDPDEAQLLVDQAFSTSTPIDPAYEIERVLFVSNKIDLLGDLERFFPVGGAFTITGGGNAGAWTVAEVEVLDVGGDETTRITVREPLVDDTTGTVTVDGDTYYRERVELLVDHYSAIQFRVNLSAGFPPILRQHVFDFDRQPRLWDWEVYPAYDTSSAKRSVYLSYAGDEDTASVRWLLSGTPFVGSGAGGVLIAADFAGSDYVNGRQVKGSLLRSIQGLGVGDVVYWALLPYGEANGQGIAGDIIPQGRLTIVKEPQITEFPTQSGSTGTLRLYYVDSEHAITTVAFRRHAGGNITDADAEAIVTAVTPSDKVGYDGYYTYSVGLTEKHKSVILYRVRYNGGQIVGGHTFDADTDPGFEFAELTAVNDALYLNVILDEDAEDYYYKVQSTPFEDWYLLESTVPGAVKVTQTPGSRVSTQIASVARGETVYVAYVAHNTTRGTYGRTRSKHYERPDIAAVLSLRLSFNADGDAFLTWSGPSDMLGIRYESAVDSTPSNPTGSSDKLPTVGDAANGTDQVESAVDAGSFVEVKARRIMPAGLGDQVFAVRAYNTVDETVAEIFQASLMLKDGHVWMSWSGENEVNTILWEMTTGTPPVADPDDPTPSSEEESGQAGLIEVLPTVLAPGDVCKVKVRGRTTGGILSDKIVLVQIIGGADVDVIPQLYTVEVTSDNDGDVTLTWVGDDDFAEIWYELNLASGPFDADNYPVAPGEVGSSALQIVGASQSGSYKIAEDALNAGLRAYVTVRAKNGAGDWGPPYLRTVSNDNIVQIGIFQVSENEEEAVYRVRAIASRKGNYRLIRSISANLFWATQLGEEIAEFTDNYEYEQTVRFDDDPALYFHFYVKDLDVVPFALVSNIAFIASPYVRHRQGPGIATTGEPVGDEVRETISVFNGEVRSKVMAGTPLLIKGKGLPPVTVVLSQDASVGDDTLHIVEQRLTVGMNAVVELDPAWVANALAVLPDLIERGIIGERQTNAFGVVDGAITAGVPMTQLILRDPGLRTALNDSQALMVLNAQTKGSEEFYANGAHEKFADRIYIKATTGAPSAKTFTSNYPPGTTVAQPLRELGHRISINERGILLQAQQITDLSTTVGEIEIDVSDNAAQIALHTSYLGVGGANLASVIAKAAANGAQVVLKVKAGGELATVALESPASGGSNITIKASQINVTGNTTFYNSLTLAGNINQGTTTINGSKITTGTVKALQIDVADLFAQNIIVTGLLKSANFNGTATKDGITNFGTTGFAIASTAGEAVFNDIVIRGYDPTQGEGFYRTFEMEYGEVRTSSNVDVIPGVFDHRGTSILHGARHLFFGYAGNEDVTLEVGCGGQYPVVRGDDRWGGVLSISTNILRVTGLPTTNPHVAGSLWADATDSYRVKMSQG